MNFAARLCLLFLATSLPLLSTRAQTLQVEVEEFRRLIGEVADLREAYQAQQRAITKLQSENEALRHSVRDLNEKSLSKMADLATRDDLKKLVENIREVDQKRESDKKLILEEMKSAMSKMLEATATATSASNSRSRRSSSRDRDNSESRSASNDRANDTEVKEATVITYKVQKGEFLSGIVSAYNGTLKDQGLPGITMDQVKQVNPRINVNRLYAGQEIFLPVPSKK